MKRICLALLCACLVPVGLMADDQDKDSQNTSPSSTQSTSDTSSNPSSTSSDKSSTSSTSSSLGTTSSSDTTSSGVLGSTDTSSERQMTPQHFVQEAAVDGLKEVRLGELALQKAQNAEIKEFAQRLVRDHTQANQQLTQIAQSLGLSVPSTNLFAFMGTTGMGSPGTTYQSGTTYNSSSGLGSSSTSGTTYNSNSGLGSSSTSSSASDRTTQGAGARDLNSISSGTTAGQGGTSTGTSSTSNQGSSSTYGQSSSSTIQGQGSASSVGQGSSTLGSTAETSPSSTTGSSWQRSQNMGHYGMVKPQDMQMIRHLQSLSGSAFDTAFIQHMVKDHAEDIRKFEKASESLQDAQLKNFAAQQLPTLREHLNEAKRIAKDLNVNVQDTSLNQDWHRNRINDREGQPRSSSDVSTSPR